jgi:hypothetical protein
MFPVIITIEKSEVCVYLRGKRFTTDIDILSLQQTQEHNKYRYPIIKKVKNKFSEFANLQKYCPSPKYHLASKSKVAQKQ